MYPEYRPIIIARKPVEGSITNTCLEYGTGALNIDGCRVEGEKGVPASLSNEGMHGWNTGGDMERKSKQNGRWPANLIHDGSDEVVRLFPVTHGHGSQRHSGSDKGLFNWGTADREQTGGDSGSAARFFKECTNENIAKEIGMKRDTKIEIEQVDLQKYKFEDYPDNHFDGLVSDPPYALTSKKGDYNGKGFMGKDWDNGVVAFNPEFWQEVYRVLKPGAHMLVFGGTRTFHRLAVAVEDAGFEIRDTMMWLTGQGFPKGRNIYKNDYLKKMEEELKKQTGLEHIEWK